MWNNPQINGQCATFIGSFVMEKLSNTRAIVFGGSELDASSAAVGSVYILDISILINTVVCVIYSSGTKYRMILIRFAIMKIFLVLLIIA